MRINDLAANIAVHSRGCAWPARGAGFLMHAGSPIRILIVSHYFWPEPFRINQIINDLIAAGAEITVLACHPSYPGGVTYPGYDARTLRRERHPAGYDIVRVPVVPRGSGSATRLLLNYLSFTGFAIVLGPWLLRRRRFDIVFVYCTTPVIQGYAGLWLGWLKHAPVVQWVQDLWPQALSATGFIRSPLLLGVIRHVVNWMYRRSDLILGQSRAFVRHIRPDAGRTPVHFFPNPGENEVMEYGDVPAMTLSGRFRLVFGGNLGRAQAMETIVGAATLLRDDPDIHITLVGSGSMTGWIEDELAARELNNVTLAGRQPPAAMPGVYAQASALLLTLIDDPLLAQTVPSKLQTYLGTGKPIIAAVNGEAAEIVIEAHAGLACSAEDPAALAAAIRKVKEMTEPERDALGAAGCRFFNAHYKPAPLARALLDGLARLSAGQELAGPAAGEWDA